jgi:phosphoglycolate phosphatase
MSKKLIIFDLDGVLIDSRENMRDAWEAVINITKTNVKFEQYFEQIGRPFFDILEVLNLSHQAQQIEEIFRTTSANKMSQINFYSGVLNTLNELIHEGLKLSVVTSKDKLRTDAVLSRLPFIFDDVQTPNGFSRGKPAPDHLLLSMANTQVDPSESIYIGDMNVDFEASIRAGIDYMHADWGYGERPSKQVRVIKSIEDIKNYLR